MRPIELAPNQPRQFYRGGHTLSEFRGTPALDDYRPEDWLASTTARHGAGGDDGLTRLSDGELLRDAVLRDPVAWLGAEHAATIGDDTALLVKLLDAAERLPVHVHPDRAFARSHLGCRSGKTEAWVVIDAAGGSQMHLGFRRDVDPEQLNRWMATQDATALLASLHALDVRAGDAILVPAGLPHAIGAGVFCLELQEPTDFSVMLEWADFPTLDATQARLGLSATAARECVRTKAVAASELSHLRREALERSEGIERVFPEEADGYFRAERIRANGRALTLDPGFAVLVTLGGDGAITTAAGDALELRRGSTTLIPHGAGALTLSGTLEAVRCRPPTPTAAQATGLITGAEGDAR